MRQPAFCICENKHRKQLPISIEIFQSFLKQINCAVTYPKLQATSHLLWLYSPDCVEPGRKHGRQVFSRCGSFEGQKKSDKVAPSGCIFALFKNDNWYTCSQNIEDIEPRCEKTGLRGGDTNRAVQPHKMARG